MGRHRWQDKAECIGLDPEYFFDQYELNEDIRSEVDTLCLSCPVMKECFREAVSGKRWGVWAGIYFEDGIPNDEFNSHKDWSEFYMRLTSDKTDISGE